MFIYAKMATMNDLATALRERIVQARNAAGLSQHDLAEAIKLQPTAISKIENGARSVSSTELANIARACGRPLSWFFSEDEQALPMVSLRATGSSTEALSDLAWASEFAESYAFLKKSLS